jgi:uncharacterized protein (TIGR02996 family)
MANSPTSTENAFVQGVLENPTDDACLAFSDWLEERGDPRRAELVRVQCELARWVPDLAKRTMLQDRERQLIAENTAEWLGPLHDLCEELHFERGLAHITLKASHFVRRNFAAKASEQMRHSWVQTVRLRDVREHLSALARAPHLELVPSLDLASNDLDANDLKVLLSSRHLGRLTRLDLRANRLTDAAVRALVAAPPPRLAWLDLRANALTADGMRALLGSPLGERLAGLELNAPDLEADTVRELLAWRSGRDLAERRGGLPVRLVNGLGMEFRLIPPGSFLMGSPESEPGRADNEGPQHEVELTHPFYLGVCPVTQREYEAVMGHNPSHFNPARGGSPLHPVEMVPWGNCQAFCERLSEREPGRTYQLPTEAQWEYACRAGTNTAYCFGDDPGKLGEYAWSSANAGRRTHEVGTRRPNPWGLHDMHGNVREWCADWYVAYSKDNQKDPKNFNPGRYRVLRGGSRCFRDAGCRAAIRHNGYAPANFFSDFGLRVCICPD